MYNNFNTKNIFLIVMIIWLVSSFFVGGANDFTYTLLLLPGLILGLTIHEYSHARMSDKLGDPTPEREGRLTLNPLKHLDPIGTICLIFAGFGWGKPVTIDPAYYRNPAKDSMKVALAGPVSNFILAFVLFLFYAILCSPLFTQSNQMVQLLQVIVVLGANINLSLGVFNLLPFPPLDGSKIFEYFLKGKAKAFMWNLEKYSTIILIILFATRLPEILISPVVNGIAGAMIMVIEKIVWLFI